MAGSWYLRIGSSNTMNHRTLSSYLLKSANSFPVTFLTGPRQSGKTTLARDSFPDWPYYSLETLSVREKVQEDPEGFLKGHEGAEGLILDEVQHCPELFSALQGVVDARKIGPVLLTGSQNFQISARISQTLAGRAAILELLPFSMAERMGRTARSPADLAQGWTPRPAPDFPLDEVLFTGGYPAIYDRGLAPRAWLDAYLRTYVERDVRSLANIGDLATFTRFLRLCAGRVGQLLNSSSLGADAGVDHTTARRWLSILEASYIIRLLPPHFQNFSKRLIKAPKLYFLDTGLLCTLLGLRSASDLENHPLRGPVFENFVVTEMAKLFLHHGESPPLYFWRDQAGHEVDLIVDLGTHLLPIEVKAGPSVPSDAFKGLRWFGETSGRPGGILIYGGTEAGARQEILVQGWGAIS